MDLNLAACIGMDTELFYPPDGRMSREGRELTEMAKGVCASCGIREDCLEYHLDEEFGIFGGLTPRERRERKK